MAKFVIEVKKFIESFDFILNKSLTIEERKDQLRELFKDWINRGWSLDVRDTWDLSGSVDFVLIKTFEFDNLLNGKRKYIKKAFEKTKILLEKELKEPFEMSNLFLNWRSLVFPFCFLKNDKQSFQVSVCLKE